MHDAATETDHGADDAPEKGIDAGPGARGEGDNVVAFPGRRGTTDVRRAPAPTGLRDLIGEVLRDARHAQDRTLADVADEAAVSLAYLSEIERGRKDVSAEILDAVCDAVGLPLPDLLEETARRLRQVGMRGGHGSGTGAQLCAA